MVQSLEYRTHSASLGQAIDQGIMNTEVFLDPSIFDIHFFHV